MYPHERSLVRTLADKPFAIIGVNSDKFPNVTEKVCIPKNISWPSFTDVQGDKKISDDWHVQGWPTTYLIDKDGIIRYKGLRGDPLNAAIEKLMAEMDIEVNLRDIDHEAEDKVAMETYQERLEKNKADADGDTETDGQSEAETSEEPKATKVTEAVGKVTSSDVSSDNRGGLAPRVTTPDTSLSNPLPRWPNEDDLEKLEQLKGRGPADVIASIGHPMRITVGDNGEVSWKYNWAASCSLSMKNNVVTGYYYTAGF